MRKLIGIAYQAVKSNFHALPRPYKLNFAVTMRCQSRCLTCNIWQLRPKNELTLDEIREFARKNDYFRWLSLTGGEPFLREDLVDIVGAFNDSSKGLYLLTIPTNSLCNIDKEVGKIRQMLEMRIPKVTITVSLDGYGEMHDTVRGVPGNFGKAVSMYKSLRQLKKEYPSLSVVFGYTISRANQGSLHRTYLEIKKDMPYVTYNDFHINLAQMSDNYYHNADAAIAADRDIAAGEMQYALDHRKKGLNIMSGIESRFLSGLIEFTKSGTPPIKCRSLDASIFMDSWGNIFPSIMWNYTLANAREIGYDLGNMWLSQKANEARNAMATGNDPAHWTSCEAYQSILGSALRFQAAPPRKAAQPHDTLIDKKEAIADAERELPVQAKQ